jgi:hypothetical protein
MFLTSAIRDPKLGVLGKYARGARATDHPTGEELFMSQLRTDGFITQRFQKNLRRRMAPRQRRRFRLRVEELEVRNL